MQTNDTIGPRIGCGRSLGFSLYRTHIIYGVALRRALQTAGCEVTPEQINLMSKLYNNEGVTQTRLGELAYKDRHNTTRILNLLEGHGYVERRPDEADKRVYRLFLTDSGREIYETLVPLLREHLSKAFKGIPSEEIESTRQVLDRIFANLEEQSE